MSTRIPRKVPNTAEEVKPLLLPPQAMWGDVAAALAHAGVAPAARKRRRGGPSGPEAAAL